MPQEWLNLLQSVSHMTDSQHGFVMVHFVLQLASSEAEQYVYATIDASGALQPTPYAVGAFNPTRIPGLSPVAAPSVSDENIIAAQMEGGDVDDPSNSGAAAGRENHQRTVLGDKIW